MALPLDATASPASRRGIYQSTCSCHFAITVRSDRPLPVCPSCGQACEWRLVHELPPPESPQRRKSHTRVRTPSGRYRLQVDPGTQELVAIEPMGFGRSKLESV